MRFYSDITKLIGKKPPVIKNVPEGSTVLSIPGRIISKKEKNLCPFSPTCEDFLKLQEKIREIEIKLYELKKLMEVKNEI